MNNDDLRRFMRIGAHKERIEEITYVGRQVLATVITNSERDLGDAPTAQLVRLFLDWIDKTGENHIVKASGLFSSLDDQKQEMLLETFVALIEAISRQLTDMQRGPFRDWSYLFIYRVGQEQPTG